jgi:Fe-S-cluster-containing hydrogenase component 2
MCFVCITCNSICPFGFVKTSRDFISDWFERVEEREVDIARHSAMRLVDNALEDD